MVLCSQKHPIQRIEEDIKCKDCYVKEKITLHQVWEFSPDAALGAAPHLVGKCEFTGSHGQFQNASPA